MKRKIAFTLIEMLVIIGAITLLVAILFPVLSRARENGRRASCQNNLKQIGLALAHYSQDYDETIAPLAVNVSGAFVTWAQLAQPYLKNNSVFQCSGDRPKAPGLAEVSVTPDGFAAPSPLSYARNIYVEQMPGIGILLSQIDNGAQVVQVTDSGSVAALSPPFIAVAKSAWILAPPDNSLATSATDDSYGAPNARHNGTANVLFFDGHVKALTIERFYFMGSTALGPFS